MTSRVILSGFATVCLIAGASQMLAAESKDPRLAEKQLVLRYYDEVWNNMNLDAANAIFTAPFELENLKDVIIKMHFGIPDLKMKVDDIFAGEGDRVVAFFTASGTHAGEIFGSPASGKHVEYSGIEVFRFKNGRIYEKQNSVDRYRFMEQIGALCKP